MRLICPHPDDPLLNIEYPHFVPGAGEVKEKFHAPYLGSRELLNVQVAFQLGEASA